MEDATTQNGGASTASPSQDAPLLEITYFTDPLCCWSWGFEPQLRRLRYGFAGRIAWRTCLVGMIPNWETFGDPLNDIHRPAQMGPLWIQAATMTGMPSEAQIWVGDPPASSWPASLAVRTAGLQSGQAADLYQRLARHALMVEGRNIARDDVLLELSGHLARHRADLFDADRFRREYGSADARAALEDDVKETRYRRVGRFPCLRFRRSGVEPAWLVGWRPMKPLLDALIAFAPDIGEERRPSSAAAYTSYWGSVMPRETAVALDEVSDANLLAQEPEAGSFSSASDGSPAM